MIPSHDFWILVPSTENDNFVLVPSTFSRLAMLNPISVLVVIPLSTIDSSPLEAVVSWNQQVFSLLMLINMGLGSNLCAITRNVVLFSKQY